MLLVVLDSNALFADKTFTSGDVGRLLALARHETLKLLIPEVVLLELERQHRGDVLGKIEMVRRLPQKVRDAARVLGVNENSFASVWPTEFDLEALMTNYRTTMRGRLHDARVEVLPVPRVDHRVLIERDLAGRKPFERSGKGYRDALTWHSILERLSTVGPSDRVILVSNDDDFGSDGLDPDLAKELPPAVPRIDRMRSIKEVFNDLAVQDIESKLRTEVLNPPEPSREELEFSPDWHERSSAVVKAAVTSAAGGLQGAWFEISTSAMEALGIPRAIGSLEIRDADALDEGFEWSPYEELDSTLLGQARIDAWVMFEGWVDKSDAAVLAAPDIEVEDWTHDTALVVLEREVQLTFDIRLELSGQTVEDIQFRSIEPR